MKKTWKPTTAGILTIIAGCGGIVAGAVATLFGGLLGLGSALAGGLFGEPALGLPLGIWSGILGMIGSGLVGLGVVATVGGIFALRRKVWGLALAGAICAVPCLFVLDWGIGMGILSIIFVVLGRREFGQP